MNIINKIRLSGTDYTLSATSSGGASAVEVTQAEYDALVSGGTVDPNTFYIITDGEMFNPSGKVDTSAFTEFSGSVETALSGKQDTLSAGTNITIVDNVISAEGGGKAVSAGTNISITTGETADTINCTLPISATTNGSILIGVRCSANRDKSFVGGQGSVGQGEGSFAFGQNCKSGQWSIAVGNGVEANISPNSAAFGKYNKQNGGFYEPYSATTLFSVGNGTSESARHNAFEVRRNGDIYLSLNGQDVKLQDQLGGGGSSYSAGTNIDITNDIISCTLNASNGAGDYSFKEGRATYANSRCAHAEGEQTLAGGAWSHAEGGFTLANADYSHTEGYQTNANNKYEHASGQYNVSSSASTTFGDSRNTLFSVGNGTADNARHNAFEIRQNGDIYLTLDGQDVKLQDKLGGSYVTTNTEQIISGRKIFTYSANSGKAIEFKQTSDSAKVGFRIINSAATNNELATFEFRPNTFTIDSVKHPLMYFGHYRNTFTANAGVPQTVIGFRQYDQKNAAAYHYLMPLPEKAKTPFNLTTSFKDYYAPMGFKNGSTMITADDTGVVDFSSVLGGLKLVKLTQAEYDALATKDNSTLYVIVN